MKRWDFETEEEYSSYQSGREAMPKLVSHPAPHSPFSHPPILHSLCRAAFQYGVKMNDGRKTRRFGGLSDKAREKAKLNREWQKISQVYMQTKFF